MDKIGVLGLSLILALMSVLLLYSWGDSRVDDPILDNVDAPQILVERARQLEQKEVLKVGYLKKIKIFET